MRYEEKKDKYNTVEWDVTYNELMKYVNDKEYKWKNNKHESHFLKTLDDNDEPRWRGGTMNDLKNHSNFNIFIQQKNKLLKSDWVNKINMGTVNINKRRRQMNEYDGEFILERKYDITPFNRASRISTPTRAIEIVADFSISSYMSSDSINTYGSYVWSISQILEQLGINTKINLIHQSEGLFLDYNQWCNFTIKIKDYNEYINPVSLADCFTSLFYRRPTFASWIKLADEKGFPINESLGRPRELTVKNNIEFKDGKIYVKPGGIFDGKVIEKEILKALGME